MDNNEIKTVNDAIALINGEVENVKTLVTHKRDDSTEWIDIDDDKNAQKAVEFARVVTILGMLVMDNWDAMKHQFPEEVQNQVEDAIRLFADDEQEQPNNNEE